MSISHAKCRKLYKERKSWKTQTVREHTLPTEKQGCEVQWGFSQKPLKPMYHEHLYPIKFSFRMKRPNIFLHKKMRKLIPNRVAL